MNISAIDQIYAEDGIIKGLKSNYIPRPSQIEGSKKLYEALINEHHFILEGPCGFGKTFTYLIPLFLHMYETGGKAIVATNGIALSEQLMYQDLPLITNIINQSTAGWCPTYGLLKGKGNFLCLRKFNDSEKSLKDNISNILIPWIASTNTGDFSELDIKLAYEDSNLVSCTSEGECLGTQCAYYKDCYYQCHKKLAWESDIIVTNYHILFSDYKTGGKILPAYNILVLDEAHEAANIFREFAAEDFSAIQVVRARNTIMKLCGKNGAASSGIKALESGEFVFHNRMEALSNAILSMERTMALSFDRFSNYILINTTTAIANEDEIINTARDCVFPLREIIESMAEMGEAYEKDREDCYAVQNAATRALEKVCGIVSFFEERKVPELHKKYVYYLEKTESHVKMAKKYIKVDEIMSEAFFDNENISTAVLTSATLSIGNTFDYIKSELGLQNLENKVVDEFIGQSPFNLTSQQLWYMPEGCVDGNSKGYPDSIDEVVNEIVDAVGGGILFLCTSYSNMNQIYEIVKMNETVIDKGIQVYKQGMSPNKLLTQYFKEDHDSILVATRSFYTGIDVPGQALRCVVVDKLPFPSPAEPVMATLNKENGSFFKYSIPMMIMLLKQAIGRGVRSVDDKCVIAFMDRRVKTAKYKGKLFKSFPYKITATKDPFDVNKFLKEEENRDC